MAQGTREIHLEEDIVKYLVEKGGFHEVSPTAYDKELCLIPSEVIAFIHETQADKYNLLKLDQYGDKLDQFKIAARVLGRKASKFLSVSLAINNRILKTINENVVNIEKSAIAKKWIRDKDWDLKYAVEILEGLKKGLTEMK